MGHLYQIVDIIQNAKSDYNSGISEPIPPFQYSMLIFGESSKSFMPIPYHPDLMPFYMLGEVDKH